MAKNRLYAASLYQPRLTYGAVRQFTGLTAPSFDDGAASGSTCRAHSFFVTVVNDVLLSRSTTSKAS